MSNIDPTQSKAEIKSEIRTDIFSDNPNARFATGLIGRGLVIPAGYESIHRGYSFLRAEVYIKNNILDVDARLDDGGERDEDDDRSAHFCVIENLGEVQHVVASMRVIHGGDYGKLPIEDFFPELSLYSAEDSQSIEISRYICNHEDRNVQNQLKWLLYPEVLAYIMRNQLGPTYAVIEEPLERALVNSGVPLKRIVEPKFVPKYNSHNMGVLIDTNGLAAKIEAADPGVIFGVEFDSFTFSGKRDMVPEGAQL